MRRYLIYLTFTFEHNLSILARILLLLQASQTWRLGQCCQLSVATADLKKTGSIKNFWPAMKVAICGCEWPWICRKVSVDYSNTSPPVGGWQWLHCQSHWEMALFHCWLYKKFLASYESGHLWMRVAVNLSERCNFLPSKLNFSKNQLIVDCITIVADFFYKKSNYWRENPITGQTTNNWTQQPKGEKNIQQTILEANPSPGPYFTILLKTESVPV